MSSMSAHSTSEPQFIDRDARDEYNPNISIPAQTSTTVTTPRIDRSPGVLVPPRRPPTTSNPQTFELEGRDAARDRKQAGILIPSPVINRQSPLEESESNASNLNQISPTQKLTGAGAYFQSAHFTGGGHSFGNNSVVNNFMPGDGQFTEIERKLICDHIAKVAVLPDINVHLKKHVLTQSIISLPRAEAVFNDYQTKKKSGPCFEGTRVALLREMADWVTSLDESRMYVLSGLAGIGKSTVAYTIASRAADLNLLGGSFFFSRDEADRNNAKKFFTTIAYQLCVYNETFSEVIGDVLKTERGSSATTKDPQDQLQALILDPLRSIVQSRVRPILVVIDALDECDEDDERGVVKGLSQLVRELPSFKVILTTRPQPHLDRFLYSQSHKIFRLQDIEDKVVDGDIWLYLNHSLSLEAVQERYSHRQWCASAEEIDSLVGAAGRLFIIASTAVRYIFDKSASNPASQMQKLLYAFARYVTPFKDLDHFYTVILRNVVPEDCDNDDTVSRYQSVVGAIIFVQRPLPVSTLTHLINIDAVEIHEVLDNLQAVILLGSDNVPRIYHKSFPDYLTDQTCCTDPCLRIDTRISHAQIVTRCFEIMDKYLKHNILGLGDLARFMSNVDGLKEDGITDEQLEKMIPQQLQYACVYWVNHLEVAKIEDQALMNRLERFADKHMIYWFEVLSLIGKLDLAYHAISVILKLVTSTSSSLHQLLSDSLRFISKFYEIIKRSALHTYHSALPFTPIDSLLYGRYIKETEDNICVIEGGPDKWDHLVANLGHGEKVNIIKFSLDSAMFISCSEENMVMGIQGKLKIWDAATGTPISTILGHRFAVANDFSTVASCEDKTITFYNMNGSTRDTMFTTSSKIEELALSSASSRLAAALADGTVWLWNSGNAELIGKFYGFKGLRNKYSHSKPCLQFSPAGTRLAYWSANSIKLQDGTSGRYIADLQCESNNHRGFEFSGDSSRIASWSPNSLTLWDSEGGKALAVGDVSSVNQRVLAISANGSLLATADYDQVTLWGNRLAKIEVLKTGYAWSMTFSLNNILAIGFSYGIKLYNFKTHTFIHTLPLRGVFIAISPDFTRLSAGHYNGGVNLWDIRGIDASGPPSKGNAPAVTALALSRDCLRLACGFKDGRVELWKTSLTMRRIGPLTLRSGIETIFFRIFGQSRHTRSVRILEFSPDGRLFASGSNDETIKLWNGRDGALRGTLKAPGRLRAVALSNSVLVAGCGSAVTLWSPDTLDRIHTFHRRASKVSIAENSALIAVTDDRNSGHISLFNAIDCTETTAFYVPSDVHTMSFLPDNSQLVVQSSKGALISFDLVNKRTTKGPTLEHLIQLPNTPLWHGVPIWHCQDKEQHYFAASYQSPVPVLWIPRQTLVTAWSRGSSMIALGCQGGRVILLRLPTC